MRRKYHIPLFFLALAALLNPAFAAVSVETFTCNGMSGTAVVENGAAFSCQASIKNEDTQNSANLGTVSLLVNGNWAEATSYTGTGFSSTIGAGASTTATFSGIKSVSPGASNKFQSIQLDNSADTTVTNTNINAITIKSLSATASSSSVSQGSGFDIQATIIAGGDLGSVTLVWSGSGGCSLSSGHTASKDAGSLSHNTEATRSWRITQGSSDCVSTITASGTSSSVTTTKAKSVTVTSTGSGSSPTTTTTSSSSSGGGGGGGGAVASASKSAEIKTIKEIIPGTPSSVDFTQTALRSISVEVLNAAGDVSFSVEEVSSPDVPALPQSVYKYLDIKTTNLSDSIIKSASITFSVEKAWLDGKDKNSVRLNRYSNGAWAALATALSEEDSASAKYKASTPGFSVFAITAEKAAPKQPEIPKEERQPPKEEPVVIGGVEIPKPLVDYGPYILLIVIIGVAVFGWLHYHKYPHRKK